MKLLSREELKEDQWVTLRNVPQLVLRAVSASGGSRLDSLLERTAGGRAIANGLSNDHPLIRAIALPAEVEAAAREADTIVHDARGTLREHTEIMQLVEASLRQAAEILRAEGGELDSYAYREFVLGVARSVAEAAREGDFIGLGGQLVSDAERAVIATVSKALST
jgi:hypothetical protein